MISSVEVFQAHQSVALWTLQICKGCITAVQLPRTHTRHTILSTLSSWKPDKAGKYQSYRPYDERFPCGNTQQMNKNSIPNLHGFSKDGQKSDAQQNSYTNSKVETQNLPWCLINQKESRVVQSALLRPASLRQSEDLGNECIFKRVMRQIFRIHFPVLLTRIVI